jgi:hypothetical protein
MKYNFIDKNGEIKSFNNLFHIKKGLSWEILNNFKPLYSPNKEEWAFIKKWDLYPSVWNFAILQRFNMVYLYPNELRKIKKLLKGGKKQ